MLERIIIMDRTLASMDRSITIPRIIASFAALDLIEVIRKAHGPLVFHQSGGCCDGSQPMCFPKDEFRMGSQDVRLGELDGVEFWMHAEQFTYWQHCQLTLDVVEGRGSSFSLEIPYGKRFHIRSRMFSEAELDRLEPVRMGD